MELPLHLFRRAIPVILDLGLPVLSQNVLRNIDLNKMRLYILTCALRVDVLSRKYFRF